MFLEDLLDNVMEVISSRAEKESSTPTSEPEPEVCEADYATRAKEIIDATFKRVRQRLTEQQAHLPPSVEQVGWLNLSSKIQRTLKKVDKGGEICAFLAVIDREGEVNTGECCDKFEENAQQTSLRSSRIFLSV